MKYELTDEKMVTPAGAELRRIRAVRDIPRFGVKAGDLGGWVGSEKNLSQKGDAWVGGNAQVGGNAWVGDNAQVGGNARVGGNAWVGGDARVEGDADYAVYKNTWSSGRWFMYTRSDRMWRVGCFHGTGEELIAKAYRDSELSGRCYEAVVRAQEAIDAALDEVVGGKAGKEKNDETEG